MGVRRHAANVALYSCLLMAASPGPCSEFVSVTSLAPPHLQVMHSSKVYLKLNERLGLSDHSTVLSVMLRWV
jgi:hypothetical protein